MLNSSNMKNHHANSAESLTYDNNPSRNQNLNSLLAAESKTVIQEAEKTEVGANSMQRSALSNYNQNGN